MAHDTLYAIGEALIDMIPSKTGCSFAEVPSFSPRVGGAPANVSGAYARLGGAENAVQFAGGVLVDILGRFGVAVGFQVAIPQVLVQLGQSQLDAGLHRVHIDGRQLLACDLARHIKLTAEHEFDQLHQNAILGAEHILEGTDADIGFLDNFGNSGAGIAFFQKEPNTGR